MTIEEALTEIKERIHITEYVGSNYVDCVNIEALRMAIEALKNSERIAELAQNVSNDDLISRKAAIDFIDAGHLVNPNEPRWSDNEVVNFLKSRPRMMVNLFWLTKNAIARL